MSLPNLEQKSLIVYLWKSCVYPGIRVDYLGNPLPVPEKYEPEDWVDDVVIAGDTTKKLGAESD